MQSKLILFFILITVVAKAQLSQTLRGKVTQATTQKPILNATVRLSGNQSTVTDNEGNFSFENILVGRYTITVEAADFRSYQYNSLLIDAGKQRIFDVALEEMGGQLPGVQVHPVNNSTINTTSSRTFTVEETQRYAGSFYDPARLAISYPGVTGANDQANNLSIRGNSPQAMAWRLEGVEIVNPNHLSNAGTYYDRPMPNGGGTNILSAQLLGNSQFIAGSLAPEYSNTVGGLFDMRLRKGNDKKREFTAQAGLLGIDLSAEGPFSKNSKASYLVNYRYSFTGLLGLMGVKFGTESIAFSDLAFNINLPTSNAGTFTWFGMYGRSSNSAEPPSDPAEIESSKDYNIINYKSSMLATGLTHELNIGTNSSWRNVVAFSTKGNTRTELVYIQNIKDFSGPVEDDLFNTRLSISSIFKTKIGKNQTLKLGAYFTKITDSTLHANLLSFEPYYIAKLDSWLVQPFFNYTANINENLRLDLGLNYQMLSFNKTNSLEPRASLNYNFNAKNSLSFGYALQGQMQPVMAYGSLPGTYLHRPGNRNLLFSKAHHYTLAYNHRLSESLFFKAEAYAQYHFNVLTTKQPSSLAGHNIYDDFLLTDALGNDGKAENKGIELSLEKTFVKNTYFLVSGTLYDVKYFGSNQIWTTGRFDGGFATSATLGKEWPWNNTKKNRIVGANLRAFYRGSYNESPVALPQSIKNQTTIYNNNADQIFTQSLPNYFRTDLRLSVKRQKENYTRILSLDIQNVLNTQNVAYYYYDWYIAPNEVSKKYQLGLIPVLNWRVEF